MHRGSLFPRHRIAMERDIVATSETAHESDRHMPEFVAMVRSPDSKTPEIYL